MAQSNTISGAKGITFSGETFIVPETHDMVKTLFDPSVRKSYAEITILALLSCNGILFWLLPQKARIYAFIVLYFFWRFAYNFGIGYMLHHQSNHHGLVQLAKSLNAFTPKSNQEKTFVQTVVAKEIQSQMGPSYSISKYPIEFNTWLIFRKAVDLILMSDFTTFVCLVVACSMDKDYQSINTDQQLIYLVVARIITGISFILFNLWVKVNAHNTIKDYAWYWGDFFFRQINNEELIFDGVFEMFPHPMYSVGYIGYYGFALISKSYTVLIVSIAGHFLQMIFLHYIENPHIDKLYGTSGDNDLRKLNNLKDLKNFDNIKPMVGLFNIHWIRSTDLLTIILAVTYGGIIPYFSSLVRQSLPFGSTITIKDPSVLIFALVVSIKLFEAIFISTLLVLQSYYKTFTKFCLSNDIPVEESLRNWAALYNSLIVLTYSSFFGLNLYTYLVGIDNRQLLISDYISLRLFLGVILIFTQFWINSSIIDLIGYFGWFYGDFFIPRSAAPQRSQLTKAGIYRYLNNPEQFFSVCGVIGLSLIIPSLENVVCCFLWVGSNFIRINFIEKTHMIKVYGENEVLKDSGVTKTVKKHLIPDAILRRLSNEPSSPRRKSSLFAADSVDHFIKELRNSNNSLKLSKFQELSLNLEFSNSLYNLTIKGDNKADNEIFCTELGSPIVVEWTAPEGSSDKDWIGLYKIARSSSYARQKTLISSAGRWVWAKGDLGVAKFEHERLFWEEGAYEFRYHLDGKHDVAFVSQPFEIRAAKLPVPSTIEDAGEFAEQLKRHIFDRVFDKPLPSINSNIIDAIEQTGNIFNTIERLSYLISVDTEVKISSKFFLNDDRELNLDVLYLSKKLIKICLVLNELSYNDADVLEKKII